MLVVFAVYTFLFGFAVGKNLILSSQKIIVAKGDFEKTRLEIMKREKVMEKKMESIMGNFKETISALEQKVKNRTFELERVLTDLERHQELAKQKEVKIALLETQLQKLKKKGKTTKKK
jgi:exonuclease VII small subunit